MPYSGDAGLRQVKWPVTWMERYISHGIHNVYPGGPQNLSHMGVIAWVTLKN